MDATLALLRVAARATAASAALIVRDTDQSPVAAWGCDDEAARSLMRVLAASGESGGDLFATYPLRLLDDTDARLVLVTPAQSADGAVAHLADEIGRIFDPRLADPRPAMVERLVESIEQMGEAMAVLRIPESLAKTSTWLHVNDAFTRLFGFDAASLAGAGVDVLFGPLTDRDRVMWIRERLIARHDARAALVLYTRESSPLWTEISFTPIEVDRRPSDYYVATYRDVTSRKQFEDALAFEKRKLQTTLAAIADAVVTVLPDGRVEFVNAAAQQLLAIDLVDAYGAPLERVLRLVDARAQPIDINATGGSGMAAQRGEGHVKTKNGTIDVAYVASRVEGDSNGIVIVLRDVTAENRLALRLSFEAAHDPLTGLPNRRSFLERLESAVLATRDEHAQHAVAFLDLDRFKIVNDRFGHATGDRLLREVARVMGRVVRGGDVLARIGGDEFALLLSDCTLENGRRVAEKMRAAVEAYRIEHEGEVLGVGVSIGLAPIEPRIASAEEALAAADAACYLAKSQGRNSVAG